MSTPLLPALAFRKITANTPAATIAGIMQALATALQATADDAGAAITAWRVTLGAGNDYVLAEPPVSSPVAGKFVMIWAGAAASQPHASMMNTDTSATGVTYVGMWVANPGATVSRADYSNWTTSGPFSGTGQFLGWLRWSAPTAPSRVVVFQSAEYAVAGVDDTGRFATWGGTGIQRLDTAAGESGLGGRAFDYGCSGGAIVASWTAVIAAGVLTAHSSSAGGVHWFYRRPGTSVVRPMTLRGSTGVSVGPQCSQAGEMCDEFGNCEPEVIAFRDVGSGVPVNSKVGRHRAFFLGPWVQSDLAIRNAVGARIFLTLGASLVASGDTLALPV